MIDPAGSRHAPILVVGDLVAYLFSLVLALALRYSMIPSRALLAIHLPPFLILFALFLIINFSAGLYNKQALLTAPSRAFGLLIQSQLIAVLVSVAFFYFAPVAIAPKANLFIYAVISTIALIVWRMIMFPVVSTAKNQRAALIGTGEGIKELYEEVNTRGRYGLVFTSLVEPAASTSQTVAAISQTMKDTQASVIAADLHNRSVSEAMPFLYSLIFSGTVIIDAARLYEGIFDRIPLSMVGERWLVENTGSTVVGRRVYDVLKRAMDIIVAFILGIISLIFYPFVYVAIKAEDKGPLFIKQDRIGRNGKLIKIIKFRSMGPANGPAGAHSGNDQGAYANGGKTELKITRVGRIIRLTRIDELPQLWNVLRGDISLIGPRPELPALVAVYEKEIPYYHVRHLIQPGLSGWAQIYHQAHPHHTIAVDDTRDKLSYDLYYVKNRSFMLDVRIALQTIRALISRRGV